MMTKYASVECTAIGAVPFLLIRQLYHMNGLIMPSPRSNTRYAKVVDTTRTIFRNPYHYVCGYNRTSGVQPSAQESSWITKNSYFVVRPNLLSQLENNLFINYPSLPLRPVCLE